MEAIKTVNDEIIPFVRYWNQLTADKKKEFLNLTRPYISNSNMYTAIRSVKFTKLQQYYLESILNQQFIWTK